MEFSDRFAVIVKPNSSRTEYIGIDNEGRYKINIKEKAEDNKANIELIKLLKKYFSDEYEVKNIKILKGLKSRDKIIEVS